MAKDILYKPNLGYEKNYYTEGSINSIEQNAEDYAEREDNKEELLNSLIDNIDKKLEYMPNTIINTYFAPYYAMKDEYKRVIAEYAEENLVENDDKDKEPINPISNDGDNTDLDEDEDIPLFETENDFYIDIKDPLADPVSLLKKTYYFNFIDIYEDYLTSIESTLSNYIYSIMEAVSNAHITDYSTDYSTINLKNKTFSHLTDYLIKSDITIDQTMRLHRKLYQIDEIILHIRSIRIAKEQMIRYHSIPERKQDSQFDIESNIILKESIRVSEKKYEENLLSLYKYLKSCVILLEDSLKALSKQNKAKLIININK